MYTFDENIFSDMYKEAFGSRPRSHRFYDPETSADEKQIIWDQVAESAQDSINEEECFHYARGIDFENRITKTIALGAKDREDAIRWILDGEDLDEMDFRYGGGYICFHFGLSYADYEAELKQVVEKFFV